MADHHNDHIGAITGAVFVFNAGLFAICAWRNWGLESHWLIPLFGLPIGVQAIGLLVLYFKPRKDNPKVTTFYCFYLATMFSCVLSYCSLWLCYMSSWRSKGWLSYLAVFLVLYLLLLIAIMTFALMAPQGENGGGTSPQPGPLRDHTLHFLTNLRAGVAHMPFWVLLHSFTVFLSVTYLFGFAFAFHDRAIDESEMPPLYMAALPFNKKAQAASSNLIAGDPPCFYLHFEENKSNLEKEDINLDAPIFREIDDHLRKKAQRRKNNFDTFERVLKLLDKYSEHTKQIQINLIGHADDKRPGKNAPYQTNYQLSDARAQSVKERITSEFLLKNDNKFTCQLQWNLRAMSSEQLAEPTTLDARLCTLAKTDDKMVQVSLMPVFGDPVREQMERMARPDYNRLDLMDYMYFTIYTITTTGYGDVVPTTTYAKFLTSLANICEMFFIVGFFNVLISFKETVNPSARPGSAI